MIMKHHGRDLGQSRVRRHRSSIADGGGVVPPDPIPITTFPVEASAPFSITLHCYARVIVDGGWASSLIASLPLPISGQKLLIDVNGIALEAQPEADGFVAIAIPVGDNAPFQLKIALENSPSQEVIFTGTLAELSDGQAQPTSGCYLYPDAASWASATIVELFVGPDSLGAAGSTLLADNQPDDLRGLRAMRALGEGPQIAAWPANHRMQVTDPQSNVVSTVRWSGTAWERWTPPVLTLDEQVEAILAGTTGFVLDPQDLATMFQDIARTVPVTAVGQPVASINGKWGNAGTIWTALATANVPVLAADGLVFDGVDDFFRGNLPESDIFRDAPAAFFCGKVERTGTSSDTAAAFGTPAGTQTRFLAQFSTSGLAVVGIRRPDATGVSRTFNDVQVVQNTPGVVSMQADVAGSNMASVWLEGVEGVAQTFGGTAGPFSDTLADRTNIGAAVNSTAAFEGVISRAVICPFVPTPEQRAVFEAWVAA